MGVRRCLWVVMTWVSLVRKLLCNPTSLERTKWPQVWEKYTSTTTTILLNQAKRLKYCWEKCPLVALRDECSAKMWQKRVWQNTARLPNGFRSTTSLTPLLFILTKSWVLLYISSWRLTIFLIWWRWIGQYFGLWKLVACWWQVYNCRPAALSPLCPCGSFYPIKLKLTSTCFPTRSNIYCICLHWKHHRQQ